MKKLLVTGGKPLCGTVQIHGAKNSVLPILAACAAMAQPCTITNCPQIADVTTALSILRSLGCTVNQQGSSIMVDASQLDTAQIAPHLMAQMRSSILFLGPLLAARGECRFTPPGGCVLGQRPIDLHLRAMEQLGAAVQQDGQQFVCTAPRLHGGTICLPFPSVGATENIMLAAIGISEPITIVGAAKEPEIVDLAQFLSCTGMHITGAGSGIVRIMGGGCGGGIYRVMPDRIEAATYLSCCACAGGRVRIESCKSAHLLPFLDALEQAGCEISREKDAVTLQAKAPLRAIMPVRTAPYPGFATDMQPLMMAAMATAHGDTLFVETVFSSRFRHAAALRQMGANILTGRKIAVVRGVERLHAAAVEATDLRAGAALLAAALGAEGETSLTGCAHIARGYETLPQNLHRLGAEIRCIEIPLGEEYYESESTTQPASSCAQ